MGAGDGDSLGCDVGYGYLHRIPKPDPSRLPPARRSAPVALSIPGVLARPPTVADAPAPTPAST
jgi:hypothetical protein